MATYLKELPATFKAVQARAVAERRVLGTEEAKLAFALMCQGPYTGVLMESSPSRHPIDTHPVFATNTFA